MYRLLHFIAIFSIVQCTSFSAYSIPDSNRVANAFILFEEAKTCYSSGGQEKTCSLLLQEAYEESSGHSYFLKEIVNYLVEQERYKEARKYLSRIQVSRLSHSSQSQYYYFQGILNMEIGCNYFDDAHTSFKKALIHQKKASIPNALCLSSIYNALGVTRMIYAGHNKQSEDNEPHNNWMKCSILNALEYFQYAIFYNQENNIAQTNFDSLFRKFQEIGYTKLDIPRITLDDHSVSSDTVDFILFDADSSSTISTTVDTLRSVDITFLPNNVNLISDALSIYEEVLIVGDISGSMDHIHPSKQTTRFHLMKELALYLGHSLPSSSKLGMLSVGGGCFDYPIMMQEVGTMSRSYLVNQIESLSPYGETPLFNMLALSSSLFSRKKNKKAIFLVSDGMDSCSDPLDLCILAEDLYAQGIDIHIMSFLVDGMEEYEYAYNIYNCITQMSKGELFEYTEKGDMKDKSKAKELVETPLYLPTIEVGKRLNLKYIEVYSNELCDN